MKRIKLVTAYDGTLYHGWQYQPGVKTIEGELNRCLSCLLNEEIQVIGASRTDTGVHSLGNIAVFDTDTNIPPEKLSYALNQKLPEDIRIQESAETALDFHPRRCNSAKTYEYRILNAPFPVPTKRLYQHFIYTPLDAELMKQGAAYLVGEYDFKSFCATGSVAQSTIRTLFQVQVEKRDNEIIIQVCGSGFLYHMVRIIAGTLTEIGKGSYPPWQMKEILHACDRTKAGPTAPACGLTLVKYEIF